MYVERKQDLAVYFWLKNLFADVPFVNIEDGFPVSNLVIPTISSEARIILPRDYELGNSKRIQYRTWQIDIFAVNKSQRDEFGYRILNTLDNNIDVYDYDEGFPPNVSPTRLGCLQPENLKLEIIRVLPEFISKLYYRATISFTAVYSVF